MTILDKIMETKRQEITAYENSYPKTEQYPDKPKLIDSLRKSRGVISEIKRASPSKGAIRMEVDVVEQARQYEGAGAAAISVLTDEQYFKGSIEDLRKVARAVSVPVLCKDFMVSEIQIERAKAAGATIILLIVAALKDEELERLFRYADSLGLEILVEVHDAAELEKAVAFGAQLIGVNNRNLKTFEVSLERTAELAGQFPFSSGSVLISESGMNDTADAHRAYELGAQGVLVGEALMRSEDPASWIRQATGQEAAQ
ncbi:indole-3-glycerol phosphate synthase TrpC [Planococcus sp. CP5-4]|uniref:indole-3-glycerol phosphate synthase TrpC n=1 Tax=unclassified Planococcus (in: firmicutes) TaxID=2662419 RepID=UPI001C251236|nr:MULTISPECIES: indole-3-glycerol phosphate synthase TrpC [unclassified Planococcus (in: firmicutes)]MBU9672343.1 indole-3-glycerol phosphate synthase TrpC [Planococcus sp. CP5-4_YE]MBV0909394.1 indole-3-glycerol phosphate synthase TrpC [Planococcus sp. CP5-4_UN]MBW6064123.1 indole-3-glycerol phosphate synthase TrpC [Planococcus sp. CP5-4]